MSRPALLAAVVCAALLAVPVAIDAQEAPTFAPKRLVVSGGAVVSSSYPVGDVTVTIPRNAAGPATPFTLLRAESTLARATGFEARVAIGLNRSFAVEVGGAYAAPDLGVVVSQDLELTQPASVSERIEQYVVDVSVIYQLPFSLGSRARPYVIAGGGYLRQLHEGRLLVETGRLIHAGGGLQYWLRRPAGGGGFGVRGEARFVQRNGGIDFDDRTRSFAGVSALGFVAF